MSLQGNCHCGNIAFTLTWATETAAIPARACTCSFCVKHGGVWTSNPSGILDVVVRDLSRVSQYTFGTGTAVFHICARCGVVPVVTSLIEDNVYAVVNVNTFSGIESERLQHSLANLEDESEAVRLARRKRGWIANVRFV